MFNAPDCLSAVNSTTFGRVTATHIIILLSSAKLTSRVQHRPNRRSHSGTRSSSSRYPICLPLHLVTHCYTSLSGVQSPPLSAVMLTFHQLSHSLNANGRPQTALSINAVSTSRANLLRMVAAPRQLELTGCKLGIAICVYLSPRSVLPTSRVSFSLIFVQFTRFNNVFTIGILSQIAAT